MTHAALPTLFSAALAAADRGWHVFPLQRGTKRHTLHGEAACPGTGPCADGHRKWEQRATTDPDRIRAAWSRTPYNIGIATGPSALVVVDLDQPKDSGDAPCGLHGSYDDRPARRTRVPSMVRSPGATCSGAAAWTMLPAASQA
jgi:hypothetical protein